MNLLIDNCHGTLWFCLNFIRWVGFFVPDKLTGIKKKFYPLYFFFWFMFIVGIYVISQAGCLIQVWGDISEMTNVSFLLFTNLALTIKIFNLMLRRKAIQTIIDEGDEVLRNETREEGKKIIQSASMDNRKLIYFYASVIVITVFGWAISTEENQLPLQAWYPYDTSKFPAYQITYIHQCIAVALLAVVDTSLDLVVASSVSVCRARLRLVNLSLRTLSQDMDLTYEMLLTREQEQVFSGRLCECVKHHQAALESAAQIQNCFSEPTLVQFTVTLVSICATAFQLAVEGGNSIVRLISMATYLMCIIIQVYIYCYQGNLLALESCEVSTAVYQCPWYLCSVPLRRALLLIMMRSSTPVTLTAGGFITLSLGSFTSIIKASYSLFTVVQKWT